MNTPGWQPLLDRIVTEADPVRRRNLEVVATHVGSVTHSVMVS